MGKLTIHSQVPVHLGQYEFILPEVMYYLYLPVLMRSERPASLRLPRNVECCRELIISAIAFAGSFKPDYVYLSARKGWASPDNPLNRPGWHSDGFLTQDLNFVWWEGPGTRFAVQDFVVDENHVTSLLQFDEQVKEENVVSVLRQHGLYAMDQSHVHSTPLIEPPGCMRSYVKVSLSNERYNLENNSHNYLFDYCWPLSVRHQVRNDPAGAQKDYG